MGLFKDYVSQTRKPETIYFWPGLKECFAQVAKVLKPGGTFMIVNESDGTDETSL